MYSAGERAHRLHRLQNKQGADRPTSTNNPALTQESATSSQGSGRRPSSASLAQGVFDSVSIPVPGVFGPLGGSKALARLEGILNPIPSLFETVSLPALGLGGQASSPAVARIQRLLRERTSLAHRTDLLALLDPSEDSRGNSAPGVQVVSALDGLALLKAPTPSIHPRDDVSHLTLAPAKEQILEALRKGPAVVISAPTSSGKTTWLPRTLEQARESLFPPGTVADPSKSRTSCSVPRVIQTIKIAQYVAELLESPLGELVGYCNSQTGRFTPNLTKIVYQTHGYSAQQLLHGSVPDGSIVMIDEAHENPADLSTLCLQLLEMIERGKPIKVCVMSATINAKIFSDYFGGAPIIDPTALPGGSAAPLEPKAPSLEQRILQKANRGRHKEIIAVPPLETEADDIVAAVERGETPILFVAGKREIESIAEAVAQIDPTINCKPFHSKLPLREQQAIFEPVPGERAAIIATNVGGTGLTYPEHVNTVIITDEVKRMLHINGVDHLVYDRITEAEVVQLLGRIGRLKLPGKAVLRLPKDTAEKRQQLREGIPPEIQNVSLATMMLRYKVARRDLSRDNQRFIFKASANQLADAEQLLYKLDLIGSTGLTKLGRLAASYPVDAHIGKLLAKSALLRDTQPAVLSAAIDVAAVIDAEGIVTREARLWQRLRTTNTNSDLVAQMEVLRNAIHFSPEELVASGIAEAQFFRARDTRRALRHRCGLEVSETPEPPLNPADLRSLKECIWSAFIPWLYKRHEGRDEITSKEQLYKGVGGSGVRVLSDDSVVHNAPYIVGFPLSLEIRHRSERMSLLLKKISSRPEILPLVLSATSVDKEWLEKNLPPQFREAREAISSDGRGRGESSHRGFGTHRPRR